MDAGHVGGAEAKGAVAHLVDEVDARLFERLSQRCADIGSEEHPGPLRLTGELAHLRDDAAAQVRGLRFDPQVVRAGARAEANARIEAGRVGGRSSANQARTLDEGQRFELPQVGLERTVLRAIGHRVVIYDRLSFSK